MRRIILDRFGKSAFFFVSSKYRIVYTRMYRTLTVLGMEERCVGAAS